MKTIKTSSENVRMQINNGSIDLEVTQLVFSDRVLPVLEISAQQTILGTKQIV